MPGRQGGVTWEPHRSLRANARLQEEAVTEPETQQDFFAALDKSTLLSLDDVD